MVGERLSDELSSFSETGIYRLEGSNAVFMDPVRVLNDSYTRFRVSPCTYYSRFSQPFPPSSSLNSTSKKKKKKKKKRKRSSYVLNQRELSAEKRHQDVRPFLLRSHEAFLRAADLLSFLCNLKRDGCPLIDDKDVSPIREDNEQSFADLGTIWQAPLYEMVLYFRSHDKLLESEGKEFVQLQRGEGKVVPIFNNLIVNETDGDVEAEFLNKWYILPKKSCFHMSDLGQIRNLIPAQSDNGFNLIVIDPPWENGSAHQKSLYPTLPNRYFLSLPVKQLTHTAGALVALWVTNREKLRDYVEKELFPAWGITNVTQFYWLKVKPDGSLIGELDLFHHRPYECLLLGHCSGMETDSVCLPTFKSITGNQVIISIPGDHSRKPPIGKLLSDYIPGPKPARCIELFAREMVAGWTSWGNEPLRFQESRYFLNFKEQKGDAAA